jgi:ATP-dependent Zn protease
VNRFFRSALFPLIIIVLLVYLASQTLLPGRSQQQKLTYSQLIQKVKDGDVDQAEFNPNRQQITANLTSDLGACGVRSTSVREDSDRE